MIQLTEVPQRSAESAVVLPQEVVAAFARLHKRAFGTATGTAAAILVFAVTVVSQFHPTEQQYVELLGQYFAGYTVSWLGALVGAAWAFGVGWVAGWFTAFCHNLVAGVIIFTARTRARLEATRDILDHI